MSGPDKGAWSTLPNLLAEMNLTVADLHQILRKRGFEVNKKSLYRLTASQPVQKLDATIVRAQELDRLMDKNNEGELTQKRRPASKRFLMKYRRSVSTMPKPL